MLLTGDSLPPANPAPEGSVCVTSRWGNDKLNTSNDKLNTCPIWVSPACPDGCKEGHDTLQKAQGAVLVSWPKFCDQNSVLKTAGICPGLWIPRKHILLSSKKLLPWIMGHTLMFPLRSCLGETLRKCWGFPLPWNIFLLKTPFLEAFSGRQLKLKEDHKTSELRFKLRSLLQLVSWA